MTSLWQWLHLFGVAHVKPTLSPASHVVSILGGCPPMEVRSDAVRRAWSFGASRAFLPAPRLPSAFPSGASVDGAVERGGPSSEPGRGGRPRLLGAGPPSTEMAALGSPARTLRGLLRELRYLSAATGGAYRDTAAYRYLVKAFRAHRVRQPRPAVGRGEGGLGRVIPGLRANVSGLTSPPLVTT